MTETLHLFKTWSLTNQETVQVEPCQTESLT